MEDYIIIKAGYDNAVNDILNSLADLPDYDIIKSRILKKQQQYWLKDKEYEGFLYKFYDKENNIGYIIFDDIYKIKGVCLFVKEGKYKELDEKELIFAKNNNVCIWSEKFDNEKTINEKYLQILKPYSSM